MDTTAATSIGATVAVYVQLLKIGKPDLEPGKAIGAILIMSLIGVGIWVWGMTATSVIDQSWAFGILTAVANVSLTAAGTYGLILGGINAAAKGMVLAQERLNMNSESIIPSQPVRRPRRTRTTTPPPAPSPTFSPNTPITA